jgi:hypothetical protein
VVRPDPVELRATVGMVAVIGGTPATRPTPPGPSHVVVAAASSDVAEALDIMGQPAPLMWVELYRVFEIIRGSGRLRAAREAAGTSDVQIERFKHTANHPTTGPDSRHSRSKDKPPTMPMPLGEARALINSLVRGWIDVYAREVP